MEMIELQDRFAARVASLVKQPWDEIRIHYENAEIGGVPRELFTASVLAHGATQDIKLPLDALDLLAQLQKHKPEKQAHAWTWLEFFIDRTGKYRFEYKYDSPPLIMQQVRYSR